MNFYSPDDECDYPTCECEGSCRNTPHRTGRLFGIIAVGVCIVGTVFVLLKVFA